MGTGIENGRKEKVFEEELLDMQILKVAEGGESIFKIFCNAWRIYSALTKIHMHTLALEVCWEGEHKLQLLSAMFFCQTTDFSDSFCLKRLALLGPQLSQGCVEMTADASWETLHHEGLAFQRFLNPCSGRRP